MKKLLLFCEALRNRAGIERMTVELANLLNGDFAITIVTIDPFSREECPYVIDSDIEIVSLNSRFEKSIFSLNLKNIRLLRKVVKSRRPSAIITVATPLVRISALAIIGYGIRNIAWEHFNLYAGSRAGSIYKTISTWLADRTVVLTEADAVDFSKAYARGIIPIPNFTSIGENRPSDISAKTLLAVGRHEIQKGFDMLLRAWAKTDAPGWTLRIVGSGSLRQKNEAIAREVGVDTRTVFVDAHPGIAEEFQNASCFVLSSRFEGMVVVLLEAKMMGLPCISFDCPNSPREVIRDGVDGVLVPSEDIEALATALTENLNAPRRLAEMGERAREDAMVRYSPDAVKKTWLNLLS